MGTVTIQRFTYKNPISMIGEEAGICWGADTSNPEKNYKRGLDCLESEHGRTFGLPRCLYDSGRLFRQSDPRVVYAYRRLPHQAAGQYTVYRL